MDFCRTISTNSVGNGKHLIGCELENARGLVQGLSSELNLYGDARQAGEKAVDSHCDASWDPERFQLAKACSSRTGR
jgi:hypothetical protein